jgi:[acyl-carrier-protein] S-malonyltransferase
MRTFIFPGQGSQYIGMGREFRSDAADEIWEQANEILGYDLKNKVFNGPEQELSLTGITQPAVFVTEIIIYTALKEKGIEPALAAGHSLGEYAAVVASGALAWQQGLELVKFRAQIFEEVARENPGTMIAVIGLDQDALSGILREIDGICEIVNFNSPGQVVVSVEKKIADAAVSRIKQGGAKMVVPLKVSGAFHSSLMNSAVEPMREKINAAEFREPEIGFYSNYTGARTHTSARIKDALIKQVNSPVKWMDIIQNMAGENRGIDFIEVGPGKVLQGLVKRIDRALNVRGVSTPRDIQELAGG